MFSKNFLAALFLVLILNLKAYAYDDHDFQVWNTDLQEFKINKNLKATLEEEIRFGDNANEFYYHHYDLGVNYSLNKYFSFGGGYRHVLELKKGKFKPENEPYMMATVSDEFKGFKLDSRSRLEYRHFNYQTDSWRYRNKFTLKFPWKFTKLEIQPYLSDEIFVGIGVITQFNQNRLSPGIAFNIAKNWKAELYYMYESKKGTDIWTSINILGTKIKYSF